MGSELIHIIPGRPATITIDDTIIYVGVKDDYFIRTLRDLKRRRAAAHPDKGGTCREFNRIQGHLIQFVRMQRLEYARLNLTPPIPIRITSTNSGVDRRYRQVIAMNAPDTVDVCIMCEKPIKGRKAGARYCSIACTQLHRYLTGARRCSA